MHSFWICAVFELWILSLLVNMLSQIQALASQLSDLWNLMDAPVEERQPFHHVTCNISSTLDDVTVPGALALDVIQQVRNWFLFRVFIGLVK